MLLKPLIILTSCLCVRGEVEVQSKPPPTPVKPPTEQFQKQLTECQQAQVQLLASNKEVEGRLKASNEQITRLKAIEQDLANWKKKAAVMETEHAALKQAFQKQEASSVLFLKELGELRPMRGQYEELKNKSPKPEQVTNLEKENSRLMAAQAELTNTHATALESCKITTEKMARDSKQEQDSSTATIRSLRENHSTCLADSVTLRKELHSMSSVIFNKHQFTQIVGQFSTLSKAMAQLLRSRLQTIFGADVVGVAHMQVMVWMKGFESKIYEPYLADKVDVLRRTWSVQNGNIMSVTVEHRQRVKHFWQVGCTYLEGRMDRIVRNLSAIDPAVQDLFPTSFIDRCFAFGFILAVVQAIHYFITSTFNAMFSGCKDPARKSTKKKAKKSMESAQTGPFNTSNDGQSSVKSTSAASSQHDGETGSGVANGSLSRPPVTITKDKTGRSRGRKASRSTSPNVPNPVFESQMGRK